MPTKPQCKIGESSLRKFARKAWSVANKAWLKATSPLRKKPSKAVEVISNPVGSLPAPPEKNTIQYEKCMPSWMEAYNCATQLDYIRKVIATLKIQYQLAAKTPPSPQRTALMDSLAKAISKFVADEHQMEAALQYQTAHYLECMQGIKV